MELIDERSQAAESRDRRGECARFEALIAVRVGAELQGAAAAMLDEHVRDCADCRALANTMAPVDDAASDHPTLPAIDHKAYALGSEVARGGMGRILAARDLRIGRPVAVKELLAKSATLAARFEREARVTARLQHPGIVPIYEIGTWDNGTPFYAMRMVAGKTLRAALADRPTLEARLALLPSVLAAAEAVAFAHAHQVIHRDLTPSNILVGEYGETVVIDWGLAKDLSVETADDADAGPYRRDPSASADLTAAGAVIGTASYMPPEQAAGDRVDARADVYALGAILYHLLAGIAPYKGSLDDVLRAVKSEPPAPLPPVTPRDLASIVAKAMARDPRERYASAKELAAELAAFQAGRLVGAHEYTRGELIRRWVRKRRGVLAMAALALVALGLFGAFAIRRIVDERDAADEQRVVAEVQRSQSQTLSNTLLVEQGRQELLAGHHERGAALLAEAYKTAPDDAMIRRLLGFAMRRLEAFERLQPPSADDSVGSGARIEASPDGSRYVVRLETRSWLSETRPGAPVVVLDNKSPADWPHFSADGRWIVARTDSFARVWDSRGNRVREVALGRKVSWAGFSRDSTTVVLLADDGAWGTWSIASGERLRFVEPRGKGMGARPGAFANGSVGDTLPVITSDGKAVIWDVSHGVELTRFEHGAGLATPFSTDYDGNTLLTCGLDGRIKRWDVRTRKLVETIVEPSGGIATCSLSPTGQVASSSLKGSSRVWSTSGLATVSVESEASLVMFAMDGQRLVFQNMSHEVSIRDAQTGTLIAEFGAAGVSRVDDRLFLLRTDAAVDTVRVSSLGLAREALAGVRWRLDESDEARALLVAAPDGSVSLRGPAGTSKLLPIVDPFAISADGRRIAGWNGHGLSILTGAGEVQREVTLDAAPYRLTLSRDGSRIAGRFIGDRVVMWDAATGAQLGALDNLPFDQMGFDVVHRLALMGPGGSFRLWDPPTVSVSISTSAWMFTQVDDGSLIAVSTGDRVDVIDTHTGRAKLSIPDADRSAFDRPVSGGGTGSLFVRGKSEVSQWSTSTWKRIRRFPLADDYSRIAASPDGTLIATSGGIWETHSGRQLASFDRGTPGMVANGNGFQTELDGVMFSERGDELRVETSAGVRVWDVRLETRGPDEIAAIVARRQPWRVLDGQLVLSRTVRDDHALTSIRGRATYRGKPVADAQVISTFMDRLGEVARTAADGTFEIPRGPGRYKLTVQSRELGAFGEAELTASEHPAIVDIPLTYEASIAGRVLTRSGRAFPHAIIGATGLQSEDSGDAKTGADGSFKIGVLRGGLDYKLEIVDLRVGVPPRMEAPLPQIHLASATAHHEGLEIIVDDDPVVPNDRIEPSVFYRLSTRWQPARSLDVRNEGRVSRNLQMAPTAGFTGQLWKLVPVGAEYRLSTQWQGESNRLGIDGDRPRLVKDGTRTWQLERRSDGGYRIRAAGDPRCLAAGLRLSLVSCTDAADQQWILTATVARTP